MPRTLKKRTLKKRNQSIQKNYNQTKHKKYRDILNMALLFMHGYSAGELSYKVFTDKDYSFIKGILQRGIQEGWTILTKKKEAIDLSCHSLCCTVSILNYMLILKQDFHQLTDLEKLYLFFIYYFNPLSSIKKKLSHEASIKKIEELIKLQLEKYEVSKKQKGVNDKSTKQYKKNYKRQLTKKVNIIKNKLTMDAYVCSSLDCSDILQSQKDTMNQSLSIEKFCKEAPVIFKGVVIMMMNAYKQKYLSIIPSENELKQMNTYSLYNLCNKLDPNTDSYSWADGILDSYESSNSEEEIKTLFIDKLKEYKNLEIFKPQNNRYMLELNLSEFIDKHRSNVIFIPTIYHYKEMDYYKQGEFKPILKSNNDLWVFTNYNMREGTIDKLPVNQLTNDYYITVILDGDDNDFFIEGQKKANGRKLLDFISGKRIPSIYSLDKSYNKYRKQMNCQELIMNSISIHWLISTKNNIIGNLAEWGLPDHSDHFENNNLVKEIVL